MKLLCLVIMFAMTSASFAQSNWSLINEVVTSAKTKKEIKDLEKKFPFITYSQYEQQFGAITFLAITESFYKYIGSTTCEATDARLLQEDIHFQACFGNGSNCLGSVTASPSESDPCINE